MTRGRHLRLVAAATLPMLLVVALVGGATRPMLVVSVVVWLLAVLVTAEMLWRRLEPMSQLIRDELGASNGDEAVQAIHALTAQSRELEDENRHLERLVEDLSRSLGEGLVVVDDELRIRLINPVALRFCGVDQVATGALLVEVLRDPEALEVLERAAGGDGGESVLLENPRGLWELRAFPVSDGGAVALVSDVGLIRQASEFRRRFVQDLSHELRSPLASLRTTVEAMEDDLPPQLVELMVRQVERVDRLARELDELVSIESGVLELELEPVDIAGVVRTVCRDFTPEAERASVALTNRVEDGGWVLCDRRGLYRVLSNLVDNAIKYNRPGGTVTLTRQQRDESTAITVADTGDGIPAAELGAVFQRFYRVDRVRTPGQAGLGLGLSIVKHLSQHMGGELEIDSREGVGTRVTVLLPTADPTR